MTEQEISTTRTLEWERRPIREVLRLSWPICVSMVSFSVMTLVDTLFVSGLGEAALTGVGLGGVFAFTIICFGFGLLRGVKVLASQAVGAGRDHRPYLGAGLGLSLVMAVGMVAVGILSANLAPHLTHSVEAGVSAKTYLLIRMMGAPAMLVFVTIREYRYGIGDSKTAMWASLLGNVTNIGLDYLFIVHLGWGVAGAAWASVAGHAVEVVFIASRQHLDGWHFQLSKLRHARAVFRLGFPSGVQFLLEVGAFMVLAALLSALNDTEMAAHQIAIQVVHLTFLPILAVSEGAAVMVGQAVGARRDAWVLRLAKITLAIATVWALLCTLGLVVGNELIADAFRVEGQLRVRVIQLLWVAAAFQWLDAANAVARCTLRGTGDVRMPALIGITAAWLLLPPLTWLLGYELGLGALGGWIALCAEIAVGAALMWWRLGFGHWREVSRRERARLETSLS